MTISPSEIAHAALTANQIWFDFNQQVAAAESTTDIARAVKVTDVEIRALIYTLHALAVRLTKPPSKRQRRNQRGQSSK